MDPGHTQNPQPAKQEETVAQPQAQHAIVPRRQHSPDRVPLQRRINPNDNIIDNRLVYRPLSHPDLQIDRRVVGLILPGWFFDSVRTFFFPFSISRNSSDAQGCYLRAMPLDCIRIIILLMKCYKCTKCFIHRDMKDLTLLSASKLRLAEKNLFDYPDDVCCMFCKVAPKKLKIHSSWV
jgi:hypothetical protein